MARKPDLEALLRREDESIEWKQDVAEVEDVVKTLTAFANGETGGWVLCGVEEGKDDHGFPLPKIVGLTSARWKAVEGEVLALCRSRVSPPLSPTIEEWAVTDRRSKRLLGFFVPASKHAHSYRQRDGSEKHWVRSSSRTIQARGGLLADLLRRKDSLPPFLQRPCLDASLEDLRSSEAERFFEEASLPSPHERYLEAGITIDAFSRPLVASHPRAPGDSEAVPTYLALLLFGREPTRFLPGAFLVLTVYDGISRTGSHSQQTSLTGTISQLFEDTVARLTSYAGFDIDKSADALSIRQNRPRYSTKALQEAVVNALAHRDYESQEPTRVTLFSDRIEIVNPGRDLTSGSDPQRSADAPQPARWRNPGLASFLLRMGLAQSQGQGLPTILEETRALTGREAEIRRWEDSFEIVIPAFRPSISAGLQKELIKTAGAADGLILISIGAPSIRPVVEENRSDLGLQAARLLLDLTIPEYVDPESQDWEIEARRIREGVRRWVESTDIDRLHLFYRGPVILAPLLGALISPVKPLVVYHYENGRYTLAYVLDRRFLRSND